MRIKTLVHQCVVINACPAECQKILTIFAGSLQVWDDSQNVVHQVGPLLIFQNTAGGGICWVYVREIRQIHTWRENTHTHQSQFTVNTLCAGLYVISPSYALRYSRVILFLKSDKNTHRSSFSNTHNNEFSALKVSRSPHRAVGEN